MRRLITTILCCGAVLGLAMEPCGAAAPPEFTHELWGRTGYGDGYVYGPAFRSSGVSVVDIDVDNDNDFVLPGFRSAPQLMRNLGSNRAFYPGGPRDLNVPQPGANIYLARYMDFADVNADGRPDLLVAVDNYNTYQSSVVWYRNDGPIEGPAYSLQGTIFTGTQGVMSMGPVNWADLDGDGLKDVFFLQYYLSDPARSHRLFHIHNAGAPTAPSWPGASAAEMTNLSSLMPPRYLLPPKSLRTSTPWLHPKEQAVRAAKSAYDARVYDIEFADWDQDGDLDFLFYDSESGVDWVRNLGTAQAPAWDTIIDRYSTPYTQSSSFSRVFGSFAVRPGPFWPDFYVSVQGRLLTWRYNLDIDEYEVVQQNAVAYEAGQGPPAFWDYDGDGDLDLFRGGIGTGSIAYLLLFPNDGTPYQAVWGDYAVVDNTDFLGVGSAANDFRQDAMVFADADHDGLQEFFVQGQDGTVQQYFAYPPDTAGGEPTFTLDTYDTDLGSIGWIGLLGETGIQPRGIAIADFSTPNNTQYLDQMIVACATTSGGKLFWLTQEPTGVLVWNPEIDISSVLRDEFNGALDLNRIESMAATDLDRDGRPDLIVTLADAPPYRECSQHFYRNTLQPDLSYLFVYSGRIDAPYEADRYYARMIAFADIDSDSDDDLFIGYQYYDASEPDLNLNRYASLRFYRNGSDTGLRFWRTRVVTGQRWRYTINGVLPNYQYIFNGSGGSIGTDNVYTAGPTPQVVDVIQSTNATPHNYRVFIDVLPQVGSESKAILVIGGAGDDPLYPTFRALAGTAYTTLLLQGLQKDNIRLFAAGTFDADEDGVNDVYSVRSLAALQSSIVSWAQGAQRLLVYLVDHGQRNRFRLTATDYLQAADYANWVNQLQDATPNSTVTTVIDTCEAGSFFDELALPPKTRKAGAQRITISGSGVGPTRGIALFDSVRHLSFSLPFWEDIYSGGAYGRAFDRARISIQSINPLQLPQIDDNGNGIPDESSDGLLANSARPGAEFAQPDSGVYIGEVAPNQPISGNTATLWLADVVTNFPVEAAGALIVPPNLSRTNADSDDEQPLTGLTWVDFTYDAALKRWKADYNGFTVGGLYRIQYYVSALGRYYASPRIGFVDRINTPDAWEVDNTFDAAPWLPINLSQGHNFHQSGDEDWLRFMAPSNMAATIAVLPQGPNCRPRVRVYRRADLVANPGAAPIRDVTSPDLGHEVVFDHSFTTSESYFLRITNANPALSGAGTSYIAIIAVGTGGIIPPTLVVSVLAANNHAPLTGASVQAAGGGSPFQNVTSSDGIVNFVCNSDQSYTVSATKTGYQSASQAIFVNNQVEELTLFLTPTGTATATLTLNANRTGVRATVDGNPYDLPQVFTWPLNIAHTVVVPNDLAGDYVWHRWSDGNTNRSRSVTLTANTALTAEYKVSNSASDVDGNGSVNAVDVQLVINGALGLSNPYNYPTDVNTDGKTDAVDVQLVINAALGIV